MDRDTKAFLNLKNLYHAVVLLGMLGGVIYTFGVKNRDDAAFRDAIQKEITRVADVQNTKIKELEQLKSDVDRLKWELSERKVTIDEIKVNILSIDRRTQESDKKLEVLSEMIKQILRAGGK